MSPRNCVRGKAGEEQAEAGLSEDHPGGTKLTPSGFKGVLS